MAAGFGFILTIGLIVFGIGIGLCITIAPLIIWRNTNRTNRLLAEALRINGVSPTRIKRLWTQPAEDGAHFDELFVPKEPKEQK